MRIAVLATKINRSVKDIQDFLVSSNHVEFQNQNTKLTPSHVEEVLDHFKIDKDEFYKENTVNNKQDSENDTESALLETNDIDKPDDTINQSSDSVSELITNVNSEQNESEKEIIPENLIEKDDQPSSFEKQKEPVKPDEEDNDENEVIRAPKIKLDGPRVVGKIELPEIPPKKDEKEKEEIGNQEKAQQNIRPSKSTKKFRKGRQQRKYQNKKPLSYSEKIEKEKREAERKRKKELKEAKKRKRRHYEQLMQDKIPQTTQGSKKKKKKTTQPQPVKRQVEKKYPNAIARFWAWLNDEI